MEVKEAVKMKEENKWWKNLSEESEKIRVEINGLHNFLVGKCLKLLTLTLVIFVCVVSLSFLQPIYVADKIGILFLAIFFFELGILFGCWQYESITENTFKAYALENQKRKEEDKKKSSSIRQVMMESLSKDIRKIEGSDLEIEILWTVEKIPQMSGIFLHNRLVRGSVAVIDWKPPYLEQFSDIIKQLIADRDNQIFVKKKNRRKKS